LLLVTAALIITDGKILAARLSSNRHLGGFWEFPSGKIELGESPEQSLARELSEEFEIGSSIGEFFMGSVYHYEEKSIKLLANRVL
jgi:8-oxo-dGTP diphosphatase